MIKKMGEYKEKIDSLAEKTENVSEAIKAHLDILNNIVKEMKDLRERIGNLEDEAKKS